MQRKVARRALALALACACFFEPAESAAQQRLKWRDSWGRVGRIEYATTIGFGLGFLTTQYLIPPAETALWTRPIWFDAAARNALVFRSESSRKLAGRFSDGVAIASMLQPLLIDSLIVAGLGDDNSDVAFQMGVISAQSYSITLFANGVAKRVFARERPYGAACARDPSYTDDCENLDRFRSYYSGHSAMTATSAGLVCAHHTHLPLYGGGIADLSACLVAITGTLVTGTLRIASDKHWATDVMTGHVIGFASGYLLPALVYYRSFLYEPEESTQGALAQPQIVYSGTF